MIVYTGCARNIIVTYIVYGESCGAFESHSILMRGIKIFGSLEICLLLFGYFGISQKVDGYTCMTRLAVATNTRRRYVMVVGGKPVTLEYVVACLHHTSIVDVYIGYVYPCAHRWVLMSSPCASI